ncbi:MAG: hypothetical protein PWQ37_299 [Candidatus Petromonas sp.]|jgi:murein DD-endopeptidase MepM/ murein hydrolase activator NlpD|nr:hypothetical protein [Candidatus Petromonas sp.]
MEVVDVSFFRKLFSRNNKNNAFKKIQEEGLKGLLHKEGFYIIMFLAVCIVGTTAVWVAKSNIDRLAKDDLKNQSEIAKEDAEIIDIGEDEMNKQMSDIIIVDEADKVEKQETSSTETAVGTDGNDEEKPNNESAKSNKGKTLVQRQTKKTDTKQSNLAQNNEAGGAIEASSTSTMAMMWPVKGELGMGYAIETLTYSKTLEHFTTHHGIDIMAEENTPVRAALDGEVVEVLTDSRLGITISLKHKNGLLTRYSNLCTDEMVKVGDKVTQGQTISGVGTSSIFEAGEDPHLHFEVLKDGQNLNPLEYMAEKQ